MAKVVRYAGFAKEDTYGVKKDTATFHVDIASSSLDTPNDPALVYTGGLGRSASKTRSGFYSPTGNIAYAMDVNTAKDLLYFCLGKSVIGEDGVSDVYGSDDNILPSFTSFIGKDLLEHQFSGCVANQLSLAVDGEFAMLTVDIIAQRDYKGVIKNIEDLEIPEDYPLVFHDFSIKFDGVDVYPRVKNFTLSIGNNVSADKGRAVGSRFTSAIEAGERTTTVSFGSNFHDLDILEKYWGGATGITNNTPTEIAIEITATAPDGKSLTFVLPRCTLTQVNQQPSGRDSIEQPFAVRALNGDVLLSDGVTTVNTDIVIKIS